MDPFLPEEDMVVWLGTDRGTRKVQDIERDPRVTLYYFAPEADGYVTISGTARLVDDPAEKDRRWKSGWEPYYADREEDYVLIAVSPTWMEVISYSRGIVGDAETWVPPVVKFDE
jgi:general stress protein 26